MISTHFFLNYLSWSEGLALPSIMAKNTGLSDRTWRNKTIKLSLASQAKARAYSLQRIQSLLNDAGMSLTEINDWLSNHPMNTESLSCYSALVYETQRVDDVSYPFSLEFAKAIDSISFSLLEKREQDDIKGFKNVILNSFLNKPMYFSDSPRKPEHWNAKATFIALNDAKNWQELDKPVKALIANSLMSFLALWDVEFGTQVYFSKLIPRSIFAKVLPDINLSESCLEQAIKKRGALKFPIRRLIDILIVTGFSIRDKKILQEMPSLTRVAIDTTVALQNFVNWRDGTKAFTRSNFCEIWTSICSPEKNAKDCFPEPWPLFIAAIFFQNTLVKVDTKHSKNKSLALVQEDYLRWWEYHFDQLKNKGCTFGTAPWPDCFNLI